MELRDRAADGCETASWVGRPDLYVTFRKPIEADHDRNLKAIPRKQRAMVRKGIQYGLTSVCHRDTAVLHRVYAESVRNLGTPVFSRRYFDILLDAFGDAADVVTILDDGQPIASVMNFYFRDEVLPYYGGGTAQARQRAGNDFMYWEVMRRAADRGYRLFDFGRSKIGTGAHAFKHNWGFTPAPLHYRYRLAPGAAIPDHNPLNPKYRLFIAAWKRLPLPVANLLGPPIVGGWDDGDEPHVRSLFPPQSGPAWRASRAGAPQVQRGNGLRSHCEVCWERPRPGTTGRRAKIFNHRCTRMHADGARGRRISATCHDGRSEFRGEPGCRTHTYLRASVRICG